MRALIQTLRLRSTFAKRCSLLVAPCLALLASPVMGQADDDGERPIECGQIMLSSSAFNVFQSEGSLAKFRPRDLSTAVIANEGVVPVRITIEYFDHDCLNQPQATNYSSPGCRALDSKIVEIYPGQEAFSITDLDTRGYEEDGQRIAYRIRVDYMNFELYLLENGAIEQTTAPDGTYIDYELVDVKINFHKNIRLVNCRRFQGIPDFTEEELDRSRIQKIRITNSRNVKLGDGLDKSVVKTDLKGPAEICDDNKSAAGPIDDSGNSGSSSGAGQLRETQAGTGVLSGTPYNFSPLLQSVSSTVQNDGTENFSISDNIPSLGG